MIGCVGISVSVLLLLGDADDRDVDDGDADVGDVVIEGVVSFLL